MFGDLSYLALQQYWYIIVSMLGSLLVFLFFVQGGQTFIFRIGKSEMERTIIVNSLGRKWEFTFTTLVTFGGSILCLLSSLLCHQFWRRLLDLDDHPFCFRYTGRFL